MSNPWTGMWSLLFGKICPQGLSSAASRNDETVLADDAINARKRLTQHAGYADTGEPASTDMQTVQAL